MSLLEVRELRVRYAGSATDAVEAVSFDLPAGGSVAIVGETGSGKSTTALAVTRLLVDAEVTAGTLRLNGTDLLTLPARELRRVRRHEIGMVFQDPTASWNPTRTLGAQLLDPFPRRERPRWRERLVEIMERVGIRDAGERLGDHPHRFSGGMLQRAMIAGALLGDPVLLVADEPTSALDTTVQAELLQLLADLRAQRGLALMMISHDLGVVAKMADWTVVMYEGRVVESAPTRKVLTAPSHPHTQRLLAATPRLHGPRKVSLQPGVP
jgi:peptide/nickel transport system ATP-binding protein